jgi:hypothetical protein
MLFSVAPVVALGQVDPGLRQLERSVVLIAHKLATTFQGLPGQEWEDAGRELVDALVVARKTPAPERPAFIRVEAPVVTIPPILTNQLGAAQMINMMDDLDGDMDTTLDDDGDCQFLSAMVDVQQSAASGSSAQAQLQPTTLAMGAIHPSGLPAKSNSAKRAHSTAFPSAESNLFPAAYPVFFGLFIALLRVISLDTH